MEEVKSQQQQQQQEWTQQPPQYNQNEPQWQQPPPQWQPTPTPQWQQPPQTQWPQPQQPQIVYVNQPPVTIINAVPIQQQDQLLGRYGRHYSGASAKCSGAWLITMGIVSIAWATTAWMFEAANSHIYDGYWCGGIMLICGCIAAHSGRHRKDKVIVMALIASVLSIIFATTQFGISVNGLNYNAQKTSPSDNQKYCIKNSNGYTYCYIYIGEFNYGLAVASNAILMCAAAVAWIPSFALLINSSHAIHLGQSTVKPLNQAVAIQPDSYAHGPAAIQMEVVSGSKC